MRFTHIKNYVFAKLGHPVVKVELADCQIEFNVEEAVKKWLQYQGYIKKSAIIELHSGQQGYILPPEITSPHEEIYNVFYEPQSIVYDADTSYLLLNQYFYYFSSNRQLASDYTLFKGYIEDLKRSLGSYGTWEIINGLLEVYPRPRRGLKLLIFYRAPPDDYVIDNNEWIMRYSLALSKETLAQIRGKWTNGIAGPGGNMTLNHAELLAQFTAERELLLKELRQRAMPVGIITG